MKKKTHMGFQFSSSKNMVNLTLGQFIKHKLITILLDGKLHVATYIIALQLYFFNNIESIHIFLQKQQIFIRELIDFFTVGYELILMENIT